MAEALIEAASAGQRGEVPIGSVIVGPEGFILARAGNLKETTQDPSSHAELLAIREASRRLGSWRLLGCTLYTTLEPCPMCAGAILQARVSRVVMAAPDLKWGAVKTKVSLFDSGLFNHTTQTVWLGDCDGPWHAQSVGLLRAFFEQRRS